MKLSIWDWNGSQVEGRNGFARLRSNILRQYLP